MVTYNDIDDRIWKAVADGKRRRILDTLSEGPKSTGEIVSLFPDLGRTGVLKHIKVLVDVNLIQVEKEGRVRWNTANLTPIEETCGPWIAKHIRSIEASAFRLKQLAENQD